MSKRRVVVTGLGMLSPIGNAVQDGWRNALDGVSGTAPITDFDTTGQSVTISAAVKDLVVEDYLDRREARRLDRFIQYGLIAGIQAVRDAGLEDGADGERTGVAIGSGIGGINTIEDTHSTCLNRGPGRVSPFFVPSSIINMISGKLSMLYNFRGPNLAVVTACTTGTHNIGLGMRAIQYGDADVMVVGGAEQATSPVTVAGFASMKALSTRNDDPESASRPWDRDRDGFVLGDGAGVLVLEEYERARARGANIYCELAGFGMSADAHHITSPPDDGHGAVTSMRNALADASLGPDVVDYINAHGTSTPQGDIAETLSIKAVFGASTRVAVSSTKSMIGHLLGAAGAVEAIFSVLAIVNDVAPPTINLDSPDPECDLDYVPHTPRAMPIRTALSNSFGFGGTNGTLLFKAV
ncbi:MAG: beta-ketoacyl-ACP synthase II [Gammaproteobacteria bacterium]|nr:beta-ketoacyl-ACP synthase II [Gammaproteobacteria bacterium]MXY56002.1 beta-ketoacyl-ACP synthase II [Gammaproteobacteria bacterium]MYF27578.1 beta-ketoacyl-ACP synthase II [Gammaproteobacteria bacterium]MYK46120.1 beta-ketoacyl-ACP synthase II [Gammaproteobacteria bacterium]